MASRIQKSIKNAKVNVIFYVITAVLAFFSRKVFIVIPVTYVSICVTLLYMNIIIRSNKYHNLRCVETPCRRYTGLQYYPICSKINLR